MSVSEPLSDSARWPRPRRSSQSARCTTTTRSACSRRRSGRRRATASTATPTSAGSTGSSRCAAWGLPLEETATSLLCARARTRPRRCAGTSRGSTSSCASAHDLRARLTHILDVLDHADEPSGDQFIEAIEVINIEDDRVLHARAARAAGRRARTRSARKGCRPPAGRLDRADRRGGGRARGRQRTPPTRGSTR